MKKLIKTVLAKFVQKKNDDLEAFFKAEYKKNPMESYNYWMNTRRIDFYEH